MIATATSTVHVENMQPTIDDQALPSVSAGDRLEGRLEAFDLVDPLVFTLLSGPEGASLSGNGVLTWDTSPADVGEHLLHVSVDDGDGGTDDAWVAVDVGPSCGSGCSASAAIFLPSLLLRRRRAVSRVHA
ncbi:MAG: Ig-like domain-containing protein [Myxococcota bacterium]